MLKLYHYKKIYTSISHNFAKFDIKYHNPICIEGKSDMKKIKKGDIVGRLAYGKDIYFTVERIIKTRNGDIAILKRINGQNSSRQ